MSQLTQFLFCHAFVKETVSDFSKLAEQDMGNATLLKELMGVCAEVTMAKAALN
jgi:hypothetical protein